MKIKLQRIVATKTQTAFTVSFSEADSKKKKIFMTNTEESDKFWITELSSVNEAEVKADCKYNKNSLYSPDTSVVYYPMYSSKQPYYKSAIYKKGKSLRNGNTYDFQDITNHKLSSELLDTCHIGNIMYAIEPKNEYGRYDLSCDVWSWLSVNHGYAALPLKNINTTIYNTELLKEVLITDSNLNLCADALVKDNLNNIQYNMIYEINGNIYNDYEGGSIAANTFKAKNQYNGTYDMIHDSNHVLSDARDYVGIDSCNKTLYLKYYDNVYYEDKTSTANVCIDGKNKFGYKYPNIAVIKSINRYESFNAHKTNLYSIVVKTDIINEVYKYIVNVLSSKHKNDNTNSNSDKGLQIKDQQLIDRIIDNIRIEISNGVKAIAESLAPAHTQLYSVYVK